MDYPVIISGERVGTLRVSKQGLFTCFEAEIPNRAEITRLSVYGGGREGYLGVMEPSEGGQRLKKKLSKCAMEGFPTEIEYGGEKEASAQETALFKEEKKETEAPPWAETVLDKSGDELLWFSSPSGVLTAFDGEHSLTAIPAELRRGAKGTDVRRIGGRDYIVFRKS